MEPKILSGILASSYRREILLILNVENFETPTGILRKMIAKGYKTANKQNVSSNLKWLKDHRLVIVEVQRRKGKLYRITNNGKKYAKEMKP